MKSEFPTGYEVARRQYELGRMAMALRHAALATGIEAALSAVVFGVRAWVWLPVVFASVAFTEWRGTLVMKGARRGLVVGFASLLLPLSILRPCCGIDAKAMGASCCVMPSACWATGAMVGLVMALLLPKATSGRKLEAGAGMLLGVTSVTVACCSMLFVGEAVGLFGGILAGVAATSVASAWYHGTRSAL